MISNSIDIDFYSRQIGTFGLDTTKNIMKMKVLIYGIRGLGMEIAKNIILMGPKCVSLYDKNLITLYDLGSGFYFSEEQINKENRDEGCVNKLSMLNPYVDVNVLKKDFILSIELYDIIVITELINKDLLNKINEICRKKKKGLIYGAALGLISFIFVDFGEEFIVKNLNGEEPKKFYIKNISKEEKCLINIDSSSIQTSSLKKGNFVIIKGIEGMTELNNKIKEIKEQKSLTEFYIEDDSTNYNEYIKGGILEEYKKEIKINFLKFEDCLINPKHEEKLIDDEKDQIRHSIIYGIMVYFNKYNSLPELNDEEKAKIIVEISKDYFASQKKRNEWFQESNEIFDEKIALNLAKWSRAEISPICNFIGGIMAQEIVKYTGKYTPISQWVWFDFYNSIKNLDINASKIKEEYKLNNSRYDEQIAIYGNNVQNKLHNTNIFLIGAGALGCEYLKIFSMMGISTAKNAKVIVTDNDNIETSNLNRQFLFRKEHRGFEKSKCACKNIKKMNKDFNCEAHINLVSEDTEQIYNEQFWNNQNFIFNAVDNNKARKYIDSQCILFNKCLIDSGTEGLKAHNQLIIPNITEHGEYNNSTNKIPMCTLRQFPSTIEHCIEWGKDKFEEYFKENIKIINNFIEQRLEYLNKYKKEENIIKIEKYHKIKTLLSFMVNKDIYEIIENAIIIIKENYIDNIQKLIELYPENHIEKGSLFWKGCKRFPSKLIFNKNDSLILEFIFSYTKIYCNIFNILYTNEEIEKKINDSMNNLEQIIKKNNNKNINIKTIYNEIIYYSEIIGNKIKPIQPEQFEKDKDEHLNFIYACSNLRAKNFKIEQCDKFKAKFISGNIIPAISTTTAAITGFSSMQIFTLLNNSKDRNLLNEININLATNSFIIHKSSKVEKHTKIKGKKRFIVAIPDNFTNWDHIRVVGPIKINTFINNIKNEYNVIVKGIYLYNSKMALISNEDTLKETFEVAYSKLTKKDINLNNRRIIPFEIDGKDESGNIVIMPIFIYHF